MRIHTTSVPATKYLPPRVHCKLTDDSDVPMNTKDHSYPVESDTESEHAHFAGLFMRNHLGMTDKILKNVGRTLTRRGYKFEIVESV